MKQKLKKLIRSKIILKLKEGEFEEITNIDELNKLYAIKVREELAEIQGSKHNDIMEFVDLIQVAFAFARVNGFNHEEISVAMQTKLDDKGNFGNLALNNLNPTNPSNQIYFERDSISVVDFKALVAKIKEQRIEARKQCAFLLEHNFKREANFYQDRINLLESIIIPLEMYYDDCISFNEISFNLNN